LEHGTPTVPTHLLDPELYADPEFRAAAILTRLAQQQVTMQEAERLAHYAAGISEKSWIVDAIFYMIQAGRILYDDALDKMLLTLLKELPTSRWVSLQKTFHTLDASLKRRTSGLEDVETWTQLGFRIGLSSLIKSDDSPG
jgi:hypothetical protein